MVNASPLIPWATALLLIPVDISKSTPAAYFSVHTPATIIALDSGLYSLIV